MNVYFKENILFLHIHFCVGVIIFKKNAVSCICLYLSQLTIYRRDSQWPYG